MKCIKFKTFETPDNESVTVIKFSQISNSDLFWLGCQGVLQGITKIMLHNDDKVIMCNKEDTKYLVWNRIKNTVTFHHFKGL